jgi:hypothetical protein
VTQVYADSAYGSHGNAKINLYEWQMHVPYYAQHGTVIDFKVFRLIDPVTDRVIDKNVRWFTYTYVLFEARYPRRSHFASERVCSCTAVRTRSVRLVERVRRACFVT